MPLAEEMVPYLRATVDRMVEGDSDVADYVLSAMAGEFGPQVDAWLGCLRQESYAVFGQDFLDLHPSTRDELLDRIDSGNFRTDWGELDPPGVLQRLVELAAEGYAQKHSTRGAGD